MKKHFFIIIFLALSEILLFNSCEKEFSCEGCINGNKPPIPVAGPDQVITLPTDSILLDGSASNDPDGTISVWLWKKISGPATFNIANITTAKTIVRNLDTGIYKFELKVTDDKNLSAIDTVQITVTDRMPTNRAPVANAGGDQTITLPTNSVNLDGSASSDPDNNISAYVWIKISGPSSFNITNTNATQTQVTNLVEGVYQFELKVTDAGGLSSKDTMQVTVNAPPPTESNRDIYVAGWEINGSEIGVAKYWKNGVAVSLTDGTRSASAFCIAVVDSDVYVAGFEYENNGTRFVAKYWKNGVAILLTDGTNNSEALSITVAGSDIYVAGWETNGSYGSVAKYWKNGVAVPLTDGTKYAKATSITVVGSDVYVSGFDGKFAKYWKNGQEFALNDGTNWAVANSIAVAGSDVYVAGNETGANVYVVKYWKNDMAVSLGQGVNEADATSIAAVDGNVYVAGYNDLGSPNMAKYWKNGQELALSGPNNFAIAMDIAVAGSDVYVAGGEVNGSTDVAKYWRNGVAVSLTDGTKWACANSIVVVQH